MKTSPRFDLAIQTLYQAFHKQTLHPESCHHCAVGNILGQNDSWKHLSDAHGSLVLNYVGIINENFGKRFAGYKPSELLQIEAAFLKGCGYDLPLKKNSKRPKNPKDKSVLFEGLSATVTLLCQLEGIKDVMDCSKLFDFERINSKSLVLV